SMIWFSSSLKILATAAARWDSGTFPRLGNFVTTPPRTSLSKIGLPLTRARTLRRSRRFSGGGAGGGAARRGRRPPGRRGGPGGPGGAVRLRLLRAGHDRLARIRRGQGLGPVGGGGQNDRPGGAAAGGQHQGPGQDHAEPVTARRHWRVPPLPAVKQPAE